MCRESNASQSISDVGALGIQRLEFRVRVYVAVAVLGGNGLRDFYKACQGMISVGLQSAAENLLEECFLVVEPSKVTFLI